jgi:hypothetical protein
VVRSFIAVGTLALAYLIPFGFTELGLDMLSNLEVIQYGATLAL